MHGVPAGQASLPGTTPPVPSGPETEPYDDGKYHAEQRLCSGISDTLGDLLAEDVRKPFVYCDEEGTGNVISRKSCGG